MKIFLDTNIFVYGLLFPESNSKVILDLAEAYKFQVYVSELVLEEIVRFFKSKFGEQEAYNALKYVESLSIVVPRNRALKEERMFEGKIAGKDLQNLAAAMHADVDFLISYDRHYINFETYRTPKQFIRQLKKRPYKTEY